MCWFLFAGFYCTFILFRHRFIGLCWHLNHPKTSVFVPWARYSRKKHHLTLSLQLSLSLFNLCRSFVTKVGTITKYLLYCTFYFLSSIRHQLIWNPFWTGLTRSFKALQFSIYVLKYKHYKMAFSPLRNFTHTAEFSCVHIKKSAECVRQAQKKFFKICTKFGMKHVWPP